MFARTVDLATSTGTRSGTPVVWLSGRGESIDANSAAFARALEVASRLRDPRIGPWTANQSEPSCASCLRAKHEPGTDAPTPSIADVLWFAYGHHGEAFRPDVIWEHTALQFASPLHRRSWTRTRSRVMRATQIAAFGQALLAHAQHAYEALERDRSIYFCAFNSFHEMLTCQNQSGTRS
jgi:hypothetical protein